MERLALARDVLDKQILDAEGHRMGRVDGLELELPEDGPPRVAALTLGFVVLVARLHPALVRPLQALRRWSVRRTARYRIPWQHVAEVTPHHVRVELAAAATPANAWERWLLDHVLDRMPGGAEHPQLEPGPRKGKPKQESKVEGP